MSLQIRFAEPADLPVIEGFIRKLAEYENLVSEVQLESAVLAGHLFGSRPMAEVILAEIESVPIGFALFFHNFSTFHGRPGLYLEDLFVEPEARGAGAGKAMLVRLAQLAVERGCARLEWWVLDWNTPAVAFYKSLGAKPMDDWTVFRVDGDALPALAGR